MKNICLALFVALIGGGCSKQQYPNVEQVNTKTPIKHLIVIFQENVTFDRYFATYPKAYNLPNEPYFIAKENTPLVNGLTNDLIINNPNKVKPYRLIRNKWICSSNHEYANEINAINHGKLDKFVEFTGNPKCYGEVMGFFDGNTVTALWNYAQNYSMSDNTFTSNYGPSLLGHLNLIAGTTGTAKLINADSSPAIQNRYLISNLNSALDDCSYDEQGNPFGSLVEVENQKNIGDLLSAQKIKWGYFAGGFTPTGKNKLGGAICGKASISRYSVKSLDYFPGGVLEPFQYFKSTSNPHHLPPSSVSLIGSQDQANHQYDLDNFYKVLDDNNLPAVSFIKAKSFEDEHGDFSDPLDGQNFLVKIINKVMKSNSWKNTAIIITYDDTDGSYDHVLPPKSQFDSVVGRHGFGQRVPFLVISPYSKSNYVDHTLLNQASILKFIEYNWGLGSIGGSSIDASSNNILNLFDFKSTNQKLILNVDGVIKR